MAYYDNYNLRMLRRLYERKKFDVDKEIEKRYINGNVAVIVYNTDSLDTILNDHAPEGYDMVSEEVVGYLGYHTEFISSNYPLVVEICGMKLDDEEKDQVKRAIKAYYNMELGRFSHEKKQMIKTGIYNLVMAAITYYLYSLTKIGYAPAICDGFNLFFWIFAWDFASLLAYDIWDYMGRRKKAAQMASINLKFYEKYINAEYTEEQQEKLIREVLEKG